MNPKWIAAGLAGSLALVGAVALATAPQEPMQNASATKDPHEKPACTVQYLDDAVHVKGECDHTILLYPAGSAEELEDTLLCTPIDESLCEQGDDLEVHKCDQESEETQITVQICNLELLEDANVNDAVDVLDENDFNDTNLTVRDLLDATVNATLS